MAGNRTLKLSILADVDDLKKKLSQGENEVKGFGDKLGEFSKKAAAAFALAAAAAAAYAGKLLIDGVKAAIEDEKAQAKLATTLENTTGATREQIKAVEAQILKMSLATGVADDKLRPSFEKLVRATNDVQKAQELQTLALDIAAGSGKDLDAVSQSLARAYDGNTSALSRLGIGLSAAELKSMSFDDVTGQLANTFGGQASVQAETFSGKVARLQVAFDEAKESVGARLLPILTELLDKFNNNLAPAVEAIRKKFEPLTKAIDDNKEEFTAIWNFLNKYIVPILTGALKAGLSGIITTFTTLVNIVGKAVNFFKDLYDAYKKFVDFIKNNPLSKFVDKINPFNNTSFSNAGFLTAGGTGAVDELGRPVTAVTPAVDAATENKRRNTMWKSETVLRPTNECPSGQGVFLVEYNYYGEIIKQSLNYCVPFPAQNSFTGSAAGTGVITATTELGSTTGSTSNPTNAGGITINVNAPSAIDEEGFTRAVVSALNTSNARNGGGGAILGGLVAE
jgi:predicted  nucleic acid-binding Zn-ribbon protein